MFAKNMPKDNNKETEGTIQRALDILHNLGFKNFEELREKRILEVGSGKAEFALEAKNHGIKIICSDVDMEHQNECIKNGLDYVFADVRSLPFKDNSFDLILSHGSVPNIAHKKEDIVATLEEVRRVLRTGGEFRFGPAHIHAAAFSDEKWFIDAEKNNITVKERTQKLHVRSLELLQSYDPAITETLTDKSKDGTFWWVYYTMKK